MPRNLLFNLLLLLALLASAACSRRADPTPTVITTAVSPSPSPDITTTTAPTRALATAVPLPTSQPTSEPTPIATDNNQFDLALTTSGQAALTDPGLANAPRYEMTLVIEPDNGSLTAHQSVHYTNDETTPLNEVYFHLLPNLLGGRIFVSDVEVDGRAVNPLFEQINDTVLRVPLTGPLAPGESVIITLNYFTAIPQEAGRNYGIFAQIGDVITLAHFYPMLAVYDDAGWNIAPAVEFGDPTYADAAFYDVTITAPDDQVIVVSGVTVESQAQDGEQVQRVVMGPARDFYLALSPAYAVETAMVGETAVYSYAPAEFAPASAQAAAVAAEAIRIFSDRFGPYPYTELDIVATPTLALGVEYPGIIAITQREYDPDDPLFANNYLETTVAHEVAHQWFYNIVGNDQLNEPWLDEALAQYATWLYLVDRYGEASARPYEESWHGRLERASSPPLPIGLPVSAYEGADYSAIIYGRGPLFLQALAEAMGQTTFDAFLRYYVQQQEWEIATTDSFQTLAEAQCQCDLTKLFQEWVYE
jgi:hypothetical protein